MTTDTLSAKESRFLAGWNADFVPWPQDILVDDATAVMTSRAFEKLPDYSHSRPSATYVGKRWKRARPGNHWLMCEYVPCEIPGEIGIKYRRIEIV